MIEKVACIPQECFQMQNNFLSPHVIPELYILNNTVHPFISSFKARSNFYYTLKSTRPMEDLAGTAQIPLRLYSRFYSVGRYDIHNEPVDGRF